MACVEFRLLYIAGQIRLFHCTSDYFCRELELKDPHHKGKKNGYRNSCVTC